MSGVWRAVALPGMCGDWSHGMCSWRELWIWDRITGSHLLMERDMKIERVPLVSSNIQEKRRRYLWRNRTTSAKYFVCYETYRPECHIATSYCGRSYWRWCGESESAEAKMKYGIRLSVFHMQVFLGRWIFRWVLQDGRTIIDRF